MAGGRKPPGPIDTVDSHDKHRISKYRNFVGGGNTGLGSSEPLLATFSSTEQYITLFYVCFKDTSLIYIVESLTLNSQPTALQLNLSEAHPTRVSPP